MRKPRPKRPAGLKSAREVRVGLGISDRTWARMVDEGMPIAEAGSGPKPAYVDPVAVAKWIRDRDARVDGARQKSKVMEDLRGEQLRERRRMNDVAEGKLIELALARSTGQELAAVMRAELEAFARVHGQVLADAIRDLVDRFERAWLQKFGGVA